jgi:hypothetical protein
MLSVGIIHAGLALLPGLYDTAAGAKMGLGHRALARRFMDDQVGQGS